MSDRTRKIIIMVLIIGGLLITIAGATFAYLSVASVSNSAVSGRTYSFNVGFNVTTIKGGKLIPVADNLIIQTLNSTHVCEDTRGYGLCSLYRIRFTNGGDAQILSGVLETVSSTYTTSNLKYQLFTLSGSTYTAISDMGVINHTANAGNYFVSGNNDVTISLANGTSSATTSDVYLAIWISDPGSNQIADQNKAYTGRITFTSMRGDTLTSTFNISQEGLMVTFDANGGEVSIPSKSIVFGDRYGALPTPTKSGSTFLGWSRLPAGYREVEYIYGNGTPYIHTDIVPSNTTGVYARLVSKTIASDKIYFGSGTSSNNRRYWMGNTQSHLYYGWNAYTSISGTITDTMMHTLEFNYMNSRKVICNGSQKNSSNLPTLTTNSVGMNIFGYNNTSGTASLISNMNLYEFKVSEGNNIIANFIPCHDTVNNRTGLYDIKNDAFYGNDASSGAFTYQNYVYTTSSTIVEKDTNHTLIAIWG